MPPPLQVTSLLVLGVLLGRCRAKLHVMEPLALLDAVISCGGIGRASLGANSKTLHPTASSGPIGTNGSSTGPVAAVVAAASAAAFASAGFDVAVMVLVVLVHDAADCGGLGVGWCISLIDRAKHEPGSTCQQAQRQCSVLRESELKQSQLAGRM